MTELVQIDGLAPLANGDAEKVEGHAALSA